MYFNKISSRPQGQIYISKTGTWLALKPHRPYRQALGIDKALEEISKNRGKLYDPDVVDTCLELFKEQGFKFQQ